MIFLNPYKKYFQLSGRATRKEYCLFVLFLIVLSVILTWVDIATGNEKAELGLLSGILICISIIPNYTVMVRRLHDTDRSGWWVFVSFIPLISIWVIVILFFIHGTRGPNRFGPDPKSIVD